MHLRKIITLRNLKRTVYILSGYTVFINHVGEIIYCDGVSMEPTIQHGDIIIGEKMSVSHMNLHRGDIVCAYSPSQYPDLLCKRLMFKEYDKLPEDLCTSDRSSIPAGHCFLLGDNKEQSIDSRTFGAVPCGLIQVRLIFRIWPLKRFGSISTHGFWEHETTDTA